LSSDNFHPPRGRKDPRTGLPLRDRRLVPSTCLRALIAALGYAMEPVQRTPILSRSLAEFWGRRWNRIVGRWLRENAFEPFAKAGRPGTGSFVAFVASETMES
jgi:hypothetical protein